MKNLKKISILVVLLMSLITLWNCTNQDLVVEEEDMQEEYLSRGANPAPSPIPDFSPHLNVYRVTYHENSSLTDIINFRANYINESFEHIEMQPTPNQIEELWFVLDTFDFTNNNFMSKCPGCVRMIKVKKENPDDDIDDITNPIELNFGDSIPILYEN